MRHRKIAVYLSTFIIILSGVGRTLPSGTQPSTWHLRTYKAGPRRWAGGDTEPGSHDSHPPSICSPLMASPSRGRPGSHIESQKSATLLCRADHGHNNPSTSPQFQIQEPQHLQWKEPPGPGSTPSEHPSPTSAGREGWGHHIGQQSIYLFTHILVRGLHGQLAGAGGLLSFPEMSHGCLLPWVCLCFHKLCLIESWAVLGWLWLTVTGKHGERDLCALSSLCPHGDDAGQNEFSGSTPQRRWSWAMEREPALRQLSSGRLWYTARQPQFLKIKEKDSRGLFLPLVVVDSPKHWVWRAFWSLEFDARLIHRLRRVCTRWPRVNEHKLITFAHQGNVQLNLICTLQLKIFEYF